MILPYSLSRSAKAIVRGFYAGAVLIVLAKAAPAAAQ
jgi:hypothetical protein